MKMTVKELIADIDQEINYLLEAKQALIKLGAIRGGSDNIERGVIKLTKNGKRRGRPPGSSNKAKSQEPQEPVAAAVN